MDVSLLTLRAALRSHARVTNRDFALYAADRDPNIRWAIACNLNTPAKILTAMAEDEDERVRTEVESNPNTPPLVKLWLKNGYGEMTLEDFLRAVDPGALCQS